jgi:hypothetical protein
MTTENLEHVIQWMFPENAKWWTAKDMEGRGRDLV